jgi:hypothetical protein
MGSAKESEDKKIKIFNKKEKFVMVEFSYLDEWMGFLEKKQKGCTVVYLALQRFTNRDEMNDRYGKSWPSTSEIGIMCGITRPTLNAILAVLCEFNLIEMVSHAEEGKANEYEILDLPKFRTNKRVIAEAQDDRREVQQMLGMKQAPESVFETGTETLKDLYLDKARDTLNELSEKKKWNAHDVVKFYKAYYVIVFGFKITERITGKDAHFARDMIDDFGVQKTINAIQYMLDNWESLDFIKNKSYPSFSVLYSYRQSIVPEAEAGPIRKGAQYKSSGDQQVGFGWK